MLFRSPSSSPVRKEMISSSETSRLQLEHWDQIMMREIDSYLWHVNWKYSFGTNLMWTLESTRLGQKISYWTVWVWWQKQEPTWLFSHWNRDKASKANIRINHKTDIFIVEETDVPMFSTAELYFSLPSSELSTASIIISFCSTPTSSCSELGLPKAEDKRRISMRRISLCLGLISELKLFLSCFTCYVWVTVFVKETKSLPSKTQY